MQPPNQVLRQEVQRHRRWDARFDFPRIDCISRGGQFRERDDHGRFMSDDNRGYQSRFAGDDNARRWCADHGVESRTMVEGVNSTGGFSVTPGSLTHRNRNR